MNITFSWGGFLLLAAVVAISIVAAIIVANLRLYHRHFPYEARDVPPSDDPRLLRALTGPVPLQWASGSRIDLLVDSAESFDAMFEAVRQARQSITFENYVYWSGEVGRQFAELLAEKAQQGVKVHVLLDWFGSLKMDSRSLRIMDDNGVMVRRYHAPHIHALHRLNHRTHRRELVVDGRVGFTGGIGFADRWLPDEEGPGYRDNHYRVQGPAVAQMQSIFMDNWLKASPAILHDDRYFPELQPAGSQVACLLSSSPVERVTNAALLLLMLINAARESVLLEQSYFIPDNLLMNTLAQAAQRGIEVEIILPGERMDHRFVRRASRAYWGPLLDAGVRIYEYEPAMLHVKSVLIDDHWVLAGSANLDYRSLYRCDETILVAADSSFAKRHREVFEQDKARSALIRPEVWRNRPWRQKILDRACGLLHTQL